MFRFEGNVIRPNMKTVLIHSESAHTVGCECTTTVFIFGLMMDSLNRNMSPNF